jgi:glutathione peroxidase
VLLVVNTAANCGLAKSNIKELNDLHDKYKDRNVSILGFPSNDFKQELDCEQDIKEYVKRNKIEFDYFAKIHVNGNEADPLYKYMKSKVSGMFGSFIKWNFSKFLVNQEGVPVKRYAPTTSPSVSLPFQTFRQF